MINKELKTILKDIKRKKCEKFVMVKYNKFYNNIG